MDYNVPKPERCEACGGAILPPSPIYTGACTCEDKSGGDSIRTVLLRVKRLFDEALPKFNWGASFLDANAIALLNEVPAEVAKALEADTSAPVDHDALNRAAFALRFIGTWAGAKTLKTHKEVREYAKYQAQLLETMNLQPVQPMDREAIRNEVLEEVKQSVMAGLDETHDMRLHVARFVNKMKSQPAQQSDKEQANGDLHT